MRYDVDKKKLEEGMHEMMKEKINELEELAIKSINHKDKEFGKAVLGNIVEEFSKCNLVALEYINTKDYERGFQNMIEEYREKNEN